MTTAHWLWLTMVAALGFSLYRYWTRARRRDAAALAEDFPPTWREILRRRVAFYTNLPDDKSRRRFEQRMQLFLGRTAVTGIETDVDDVTRVLVAASAVIPIWGFPDWEYPNLREVLIVPDAWQGRHDPNAEYQPLQGTLLGSVQGFQNDQYMRLSKVSLERGFRDAENGENVGIHEFAHVLDHADGTIDGAPALALPPELRGAWQEVVKQELERTRRGKGILNRYGGTNEAELFAVATESFFEEPEKLAQHHPELYTLLSRALGQNPARRALSGMLGKLTRPLRRVADRVRNGRKAA